MPAKQSSQVDVRFVLVVVKLRMVCSQKLFSTLPDATARGWSKDAVETRLV